mgnify:CR=1 FL=1
MDLLDVLDPTDPSETGISEETHPNGLTIQQLLDRVGPRSFGAVLLVPALILVSPLSIIPFMPTIGGLVILTIATQAFFGRRHLWLPRFLANRRLTTDQLTRVVTYLRRPAKWLDTHSRDRLRFLTAPPLDRMSLLAVMTVASTWPFLEIVPMFTTISAAGVALVGFGVMVRDGYVLLAGYTIIAATLLFVLRLVTGIF